MTVIVRARSTGGHEPSAGAAAREGKRGIVRVRVRPGENRCDEEGGVEKVGGDRGPRVEEERQDAWGVRVDIQSFEQSPVTTRHRRAR